jgi:hypothetical protein
MLKVIDAGANIDQRLERRMNGDVLDLLTVDVDGAGIPNGGFIFFTGPYHVRSCFVLSAAWPGPVSILGLVGTIAYRRTKKK